MSRWLAVSATDGGTRTNDRFQTCHSQEEKVKGREKTPLRIGMFGGSFDPPHIGHFFCARVAAEKLGLDRLLVVPTAHQPHKLEGPFAPSELRCRMVRALIANDTLFELSTLEIEREDISYTVDTLRDLAVAFPDPKYERYCLIGSDAFNEIDSWKDTRTIFQLARIVVLIRPGDAELEHRNRWVDRAIRIDIPKLEISSTDIRQRISQGLPVNLVIGEAVDEIIKEHNLYCNH